MDLRSAREESEALRAERDQLLDKQRDLLDERRAGAAYRESLRLELERERERAAGLERELRDAYERNAQLLNLKVVRWSTPLRSVLYRLRHHRRHLA
jgi:hypothetical protein